MEIEIDDSRLELLKGDITKQQTNAKLWEECKKLGGCKTGQVKITKDYELPIKYVIHLIEPFCFDQRPRKNIKSLSYFFNGNS